MGYLKINFWSILILCGLFLEILGAFIVSADAIGLERFEKWINSLRLVRDELFGKIEPRDSILRPGIARIIFSFIAMVSGMPGILLSLKLSKTIDVSPYIGYIPNWLKTFVLAIMAGIVSGIIGILLLLIVIRFLSFIISGLQKIDAGTKTRTAGAFGFLFLLLGFILQFIGTLLQAFP
jgi:hypothetical protein